MSDEFDVYHANHDDVQAIVDWAVRTGAAIWLLQELLHERYDKESERMEHIKETVELMLASAPQVLVNPIKVTALDAIEEYEAEEQAVADFVEELKDL